MTKARTLYDKIFDDHVVERQADGTCLLYIDRHLVHEVTSPQAFADLRAQGLPVAFPERTVATVDHIVPTDSHARPLADPPSRHPLGSGPTAGVPCRCNCCSGCALRHRPNR